MRLDRKLEPLYSYSDAPDPGTTTEQQHTDPIATHNSQPPNTSASASEPQPEDWLLGPLGLDLEGDSFHTQQLYKFNMSHPLFTILYFNARNLFPKLDELASLIAIHTPDIISIMKAWLDKDI